MVGRPGRPAIVPPDIAGPRVRIGVLWFLLVLAAATSGRWWTAALWSLVAFAAGFQMVTVWGREAPDAAAGASPDQADEADPAVSPVAAAGGAVAGLGAAAVTLATAYSTGLAGVLLTALALTAGVGLLGSGARRHRTGPVAIGLFLPAIAAASVVLAVRNDLWAGLFLILAVSLYDAGSFLFGAEATGRWEGPAGGVIGVLAVTFTISTLQVAPFDRAGAWIAGGAIAVGCVVGQWAVSAFLPRPAASAGAVRRLDAYLLTGPAFVACLWLLGT